MRSGNSLYRDTENGRIAGVCAGIAEYFKIETWLVRILTVTAFFLMPVSHQLQYLPDAPPV